VRRGLSRDPGLRAVQDPVTGLLVLQGTGIVTSEDVHALDDE